MVKKLQKSSAAPEEAAGGSKAGPAGSAGPGMSGSVKDSAQQIWLAGLGAFAKAQQEGGKVFEALVKEGIAIQRKTQSAAEEKITEATNRMASMATDLTSKASGQWGKLEDIFEERVSRALKKLGVPTGKDIEALSARIDELARHMARPGARAGTKPTGDAKPSRKRAAAKKTAS